MNKFWSKMAKRAEPYVPGEQLNENKMIKLNTNENPYPPSPKVIKALQEGINADLRLYPSPTMDDLRQTVGNYYGLTKENVFVGNGSDEVLAFSFMGFFDPERPIRFPYITYSFYPVYAKLFQIDYEAIPLEEDFSIDIEKFFNSEGGIIFPNPNAPTSVYMPLEQVELILQHNRDQVVIVDEAYVDFAPASAVSLIEKYDNLLVIQTMSKSRSLAGMRIGFALGQKHLIDALVRMKDSFNSYPVDRLALIAAKAAIEDQAYFKATTEKILVTRSWTVEKLKSLGFTVVASDTNFVFASHPSFPAKDLYEQLKKKKILIRYFGTEPIDNFVRITIGTDDEMNELIKAISHLID